MLALVGRFWRRSSEVCKDFTERSKRNFPCLTIFGKQLLLLFRFRALAEGVQTHVEIREREGSIFIAVKVFEHVGDLVQLFLLDLLSKTFGESV